MNITLTPDIEKALAEEARKLGTTPEQLALASLREHFVLPPHAAPAAGQATLADFLREHIGVLRSSENIPGGARMSEDSGKQFAAGLMARHQKGRQ